MKIRNTARNAVLLLLPLTAQAAGTITSQEELFLKCYEAIADNTPVRSSVPYQRILNGASAMDVCRDLVDDMGINGEGYFKSNNARRTPDSVVLEIGKGLYRTHDHFIPTHIMTANEQKWLLDGSLSWQTGADYQTAVVMKDLPYSALVTSKKAYFPLLQWRNNGEDWRSRMYQPEAGKLYGLPTDATDDNVQMSNAGYRDTHARDKNCPDYSTIQGPRVGSASGDNPSKLIQDGGRLRNHGVMKGIFEETYQREYKNCGWSADPSKRELAQSFVAKPHQSFGGGLLGMSGYLQSHAGFRNGTRDKDWSDGGMQVHRRFAQRVMEQFFCRKGAVLRIGDVEPFMSIPSTIKGEHVPTFRLASTCMQCHATIDSMSYAIRGNLSGTRSSNDGVNGNWTIPEEFTGATLSSSFPGSAKTNVREFAKALPASDADFFRRPTEGALYFRNFRGNLVFIGPDKITSLDALGSQIAEQEDFYACAASKYVKTLTSYDITLDDPGANGDALNKDEVYNWFANTLVPNFYKHRSAKRLMKEIIESKYFSER